MFVIGRCTHLGILNPICHLLDHVFYSLIMQVRLEDVAISFRFDFAIYDAVISQEPYGRLNVAKKELVLGLSPVVLQM